MVAIANTMQKSGGPTIKTKKLYTFFTAKNGKSSNVR